MDFKIQRISNGPKHHMFGFHDLVQTNAAGNLALALEIDDISRPPLPGDVCTSGVINLDSNEFIPIHTTHTWNYPQGARQQWLGNSNLFLCNDRDGDERLISRLVDAEKRKVVETLPFPVHCANASLGKAIYINYDRLNSVGGYGYVSGKISGYKRIVDMPNDDGLWVGDLNSKTNGELLVSIKEIAATGEKHPVNTGFPHYVTHPMLNPDGTRVAFLHRYRLPDGGETTRLMTIGVDGQDLRCLAKGFLSHFTWTASDEIFIWGAHQPSLFAMREAPYLRIPGLLHAAMCAKRVVKLFHAKKDAGGARKQSLAFLLVKDANISVVTPTAIGVLTEDGHPMARPSDLRTVISDSYPDKLGDRQFYLYDLDNEKRIDICKFRRIFATPDTEKFDYHAVQSGTDPRIIRRIDLAHYLFARSGLHCDLHPRWSADGKSAFFDSIHEGTRQLYCAKVLNEA